MPADRSLLVPIDVRALVASRGASGADWAATTPSYADLDHGVTLGDQLAPAPFTPRSGPPEPGVHLHWAMPDALTHGTQKRDGTTEFPLLPNRWAVARLWTVGGQVRMRAWVLVSDAVSDTDPGGSTPWPQAHEGGYRCAFLGKRVDVADWEEAADPPKPVLTAVGPGDPLFAASYWSCRNVFALHDALDDVDPGAALTYVVVGWWSEPTAGPVAGQADWRDALEQLRWSVPADVVVPPSATVLHGIVDGVPWAGPAAPVPTGVPPGPLQVSVGNSTNEALAALVAAHVPGSPDAERLLEAFLDGLMPELEGPDGLITLEELVHQREFAPYDGGTKWDVVSSAPDLAPLVDPLGADLGSLVAGQSRLEELDWQLASMRRLLYATWHKKAQLDQSPWPTVPTAADVTAYIEQHLVPQIAALSEERRGQAELVAASIHALRELLRDDDDHRLQDLARGRFWQPRPPVVALSGDGVRGARRHGYDGRFTKDGSLACRVSGGLLSVPGVDVAASVDWTALPAPVGADARDLVVEAIALSPGLAAVLELPAARAGSPPSPLGVVRWSAPWTPLLLQWETHWHPSADTPGRALDGWELDEIDFRWAGKDPLRLPPRRFTGQVPIDPATTVRLAARIRRYLDDHPDDGYAAALGEVARSVAELDVISQSLSGFDWSLLGTVQTLQLPVVDPVDPALGKAVAEHVTAEDEISPDPSGSFDPIRAGHMLVARLVVVDTFGQVKHAGAANGPAPIIAEPVRSPGLPGYAELPPRVTQPARLRFQWAPARDGAGGESTSDPATAPVAGWILPNHLDGSLMLYDPVGTLLGELQLIQGSLDPGGAGLRWLPAAGTPQTLGAPPVMPNTTLQGFVGALLTAGQVGHHALRDLLAVVDDTLPSVDPLGAWQNQSLSILVGRPLALACATVRLQVQGLAAADQSWTGLESLVRTGTLPTEGYTSVRLPVVLGDTRRLLDGLVGFYVGGDFTKLRVARHGAKPPPGSAYVLPNEPVHVVPDPAAAAVDVALLLDPRAAVHASSAWLPAEELSLSPAFAGAAQTAMEVTFLTGPILTDQANVALPVPQAPGAWSWLTIDGNGDWQEVTKIGPVSAKATLDPSPQAILDGWLKVTGALEGRR